MFCLSSLAALNRRSENIVIEPIVVAELKLRDVQRHVFGADLVEAANDAALEDAPEAFNRIGMDRTDNVPLRAVMGSGVRVAFQVPIDAAFVGGEQAHLVRNGFVDEGFCGFAGDVRQDARDDVALALDRPDDWSFGADATEAAFLALVPVFVLSTDRSEERRVGKECRL